MCECCIMKKNSGATWKGDILPIKHGHIAVGNKTARITYNIYIEHFAIEVSKRNGITGREKALAIYPITCCPNCGSDLFTVFDSQKGII